MPWDEIFAVFVISHVVGDYLLQTEWQALNKHGGLTGTPQMRMALFSHVAVYTLCFIPAFIWLWHSDGPAVFGLAALIFIPHFVQDDGRLLASYARAVKKADLARNPGLAAAVDQSFHLLALFLTALLASRGA